MIEDTSEVAIKSRNGKVLFTGKVKAPTDATPGVRLGRAVVLALSIGADLSKANLRDATLYGANLRDATLYGADLRDANLRGADLRDANLRDATLYGADLSNTHLSKANLRDAYLRGANLSNANLRDADLRGADLSDANLRGADLRDANLSEANLYGANLYGADLSNTHLSKANLCNADLYDANLSGADLSGAVLRYANLSKTNLSGAKGLAFQIPQDVELIVYKKTTAGVAKLRIPPEARRTAVPTSRKCRAEFAEVLACPDGAYDLHTGRLAYVAGTTVRPDSYDDDFRVECTHGIHFFLTRKEAEEWI
jgi:uncharacterized protein YjbI with pentapeptide repeats